MTYMLGGVCLDMLLNSDLGNMMDLMVDLVSDMLGNWDSGHLLDNGGSVLNMLDGDGSGNSSDGSNSRGLNLDCLDSRSSNSLDSNGSGGILDNWLDSNGLTDGVNKSVLVEILRESLKGQRSVSIRSGDQVSHSWGQWSRGAALVDVRLGSNKDLGVGSWG